MFSILFYLAYYLPFIMTFSSGLFIISNGSVGYNFLAYPLDPTIADPYLLLCYTTALDCPYVFSSDSLIDSLTIVLSLYFTSALEIFLVVFILVPTMSVKPAADKECL